MKIVLEMLLLSLGFLLLVKGADWFVDGASGVAAKLRIPQLVIGLTIVAMGTSAPEAAVSISAALKGSADITIGNIVGSNILNILIILGLAAALEDACANLEANTAKVVAMRDRLSAGLSQIPHSALNGDPQNRLPGNVSFCFEGIEGESLLLLLDAKGVCASSGSACTSGSLDPSHVLLAIGRVHDVAHGSLRLSLCHYNTEEEVDHILKVVPEVVQLLRNMSPVWRDLQAGKREYIL